jgi:hypothetical protein
MNAVKTLWLLDEVDSCRGSCFPLRLSAEKKSPAGREVGGAWK